MTEEKKKVNIIEETKSISFIVFIALIIRILVIEPFFIPSASMNNTLLEGDYLFSTKYSYGYSKHSLLFFAPDSWHGRILAPKPKRGDIIIFRPPHMMETRYIKRLVALPGDKIQVIEGVVYINDKPLERKYIDTIVGEDGDNYKQYIEASVDGVEYAILQRDSKDERLTRYNNTKVFHVPEDQYFFMGDNRNNSEDSRGMLGYVPFENFIAKAQFIYLSQEKYLWLSDASFIDQVKQVYHWICGIRPSRMFRSVYNISKLEANYHDLTRQSAPAGN